MALRQIRRNPRVEVRRCVAVAVAVRVAVADPRLLVRVRPFERIGDRLDVGIRAEPVAVALELRPKPRVALDDPVEQDRSGRSAWHGRMGASVRDPPVRQPLPVAVAGRYARVSRPDCRRQAFELGDGPARYEVRMLAPGGPGTVVPASLQPVGTGEQAILRQQPGVADRFRHRITALPQRLHRRPRLHPGGRSSEVDRLARLLSLAGLYPGQTYAKPEARRELSCHSTCPCRQRKGGRHTTGWLVGRSPRAAYHDAARILVRIPGAPHAPPPNDLSRGCDRRFPQPDVGRAVCDAARERDPPCDHRNREARGDAVRVSGPLA